MKVEILKKNKNAVIPKRMTEGSAGYDLYSSNSESIIIKAGKLKLIPTGISISLPIGYEAQIRPRSGLALKNSIGILNSPGTIDADYRGEIGIIVYNFGDKDFEVKSNMRIAQMVIAKHEIVEFIEVKKLDVTERNDNGFGHSNT
jgi:dUTP pyrophosphatase